MAAPSYAQSMHDIPIRGPMSSARSHGFESEGELSSIPDISTVATYSDTDESEAPAVTSFDRRKRGFVSSINSLKARLNRHSTNADTLPGASSSASAQATSTLAGQSLPSSSPADHADVSDFSASGSGHSRAGSIVTLSRLSFSSRLSQLTSIPLPTASSLSARISSQPSAHLTARCLAEAADQIKVWTRKALDVLGELDAQDDVEWSAAGGREGLDEVDQAITRFEGLVKVYVISMEELQMRSDIRTLSDETLKGHVDQMEVVVNEWAKIKSQLKGVKKQVEVAMDWEELWNTELGGAGQELSALGDLIFEMEEQRHRAAQAHPTLSPGKTFDLDDIAESPTPGRFTRRTPTRSQTAMPHPFSTGSPSESAAKSASKDEETLLGLFARMQTVRATLDFIPMKLSTFLARATALFPTGCEELTGRKEQLEEQWIKLESDAEALRNELGEDRWLIVFRNSGQQAQKMFDSVERSHLKLVQSLDAGIYQSDPHAFAKTAESFDAKRLHYVPAIDRVLALIDKGIKDRLSVNGEILRMQSEMKRRSIALKTMIRDMDDLMDKGPVDSHGQHLRDSISTILSERSRTSSILDTPHSSPASSVMMESRNSSVNGRATPTSLAGSKMPKARRMSAFGPSTPMARPARLSDVHRTVTSPLPRTAEPYTGNRPEVFRELKEPGNKPRWNAGGRATPSSTKGDFLPLSATEPSPYRKMEATPRRYTSSRYGQLPTPTGASQVDGSGAPESPAASASVRRQSAASRLPPRASSALDFRTASTVPSTTLTPTKTRTASSPRLQPPSTPLTTRKYSLATKLPTLRDEDDGTDSVTSSRPSISRPPSSLSTATNTTRTSTTGQTTAGASSSTTASGRRSSLAGLGTPGRRTSSLLSPQGVWARGGAKDRPVGARAASALGVTREEGKGERPRWR